MNYKLLALVTLTVLVVLVIVFFYFVRIASEALYQGLSFLLLISAVLGGAGYKMRRRGKI